MTALKNLKNLKYIDIHNCLIDDLEPISELTEIEYLLLRNNPLKTIKPICHFKKLKKIEMSNPKEYSFNYNQSEFKQLKTNSINCEVKQK